MLDRLNRHDLTDEEWDRLRGLLPADPSRGGRWADHRSVINGIFFRTRIGCPWRDLPEGFGTGRPSVTGIAAGRVTAPGSRSGTGCGPGAMRPRARTGRSARIPPWSFTSAEVVYGVTGTDVTRLPEYGVSP